MRRRGLTLAELLLLVAVVVALVAMVAYALTWGREKARRDACSRNLAQLARGMEMYLGWGHYFACPLGRGSKPNDFNGAEWLASLYWSGVMPDPLVFICPSSDDWNCNGLDIGTHVAAPTFGSRTVSFAGIHYRSLTRVDGSPFPCAIRLDYPTIMALASDDTQGSINHGPPRRGGMNVVYFSGRVEWKTHEEVDLECGVGQKGGLLWQLRN